jgi:hypothetical protein
MVMFFVLVLVIDESRIVVLLSVCKGKTKDGDMQHGHVRNSSAGRLRLTGALHCIAKCEDAVQIVPIPRIENVLLVGMAFTVVKGTRVCLSVFCTVQKSRQCPARTFVAYSKLKHLTWRHGDSTTDTVVPRVLVIQTGCTDNASSLSFDSAYHVQYSSI